MTCIIRQGFGTRFGSVPRSVFSRVFVGRFLDIGASLGCICSILFSGVLFARLAVVSNLILVGWVFSSRFFDVLDCAQGVFLRLLCRIIPAWIGAAI